MTVKPKQVIDLFGFKLTDLSGTETRGLSLH